MRNPVDAAVAFFAPKAALQRARARVLLRAYDGATVGRRGNAWNARGTSANTEVTSAMSKLRDRARELARNNPHAVRALDIFVSHSIGTGLRAVPRTGSTGLNSRVLELWLEWSKVCDVERMHSFEGLQALSVRSMIESGEIVIRLLDMRPDSVSGIPLRLQLLEADLIDQSRDGEIMKDRTSSETLRSRLGIGLGEYDARTGLWLLPYHPGEMSTVNLTTTMSQFHERASVLHIFKMLRPGQVRGVTWFAPTLVTARELTDFVDAVTVKARVEACFAAFVTNTEDSEQAFENNTDLGTNNPADPVISEMEPGLIKQLRVGQDIKFGQPSTNSQVEPMLLHSLMSMAAGLGVTYDQLSGDLRQANYSSLRSGGLVFKRLIETFQQHILIPQLCQPIWDRFISRAIISGKLRPRVGGYPVNWVTPAWEPVNPKFDLDAEQKAVRSGRVSPQEYIAEWGNDWRKVVLDTAEFNEFCEENDVIFDIQTNKVTRAGSLQPDPAAKAGMGGGMTDSNGDEITAENIGNGSGGGNERDLNPDDDDDLDPDRAQEGRRVIPFSAPRKRSAPFT